MSHDHHNYTQIVAFTVGTYVRLRLLHGLIVHTIAMVMYTSTEDFKPPSQKKIPYESISPKRQKLNPPKSS